MKVNPKTALLEPVTYRPSSHWDERPEGAHVDMVVVHGISLPPGQFGGSSVEAFFCGSLDRAGHPSFLDISHLRVASHLFIKRQGEIIQFVPFDKRAWHAGESCFKGRTQCNDFSIGIELEGTDEIPYELIQYQQLAVVIGELRNRYPLIVPERIVGHSDIAPGRKTDPGPGFDWAYLKGIIT